MLLSKLQMVAASAFLKDSFHLLVSLCSFAKWDGTQSVANELEKTATETSPDVLQCVAEMSSLSLCHDNQSLDLSWLILTMWTQIYMNLHEFGNHILSLKRF